MRQFFVAINDDRDPRPGDTVILDREESHHLFTVLRGGRDQQIHLVDGRGWRLVGEPTGQTGKQAEVRILSAQRDTSEDVSPQLILVCAVVKGKRFEWVLEKAVELGAHSIWPLLTEHGVITPGHGRRERWLHILQSALKQSGRALLPELSEPKSLSETVAELTGVEVLFGEVPAAQSDSPEPTTGLHPLPWIELLPESPAAAPERLAVLIGPEGGWSPGEHAALCAAGFRPTNLGPHVLRTETAAVVGLAALQALRQVWAGQRLD